MKLYLIVTVNVKPNDESSFIGDQEDFIKENVHYAFNHLLTNYQDWEWIDIDLIDEMEIVGISNPVE